MFEREDRDALPGAARRYLAFSQPLYAVRAEIIA
jgi:hypothetical protein